MLLFCKFSSFHVMLLSLWIIANLVHAMCYVAIALWIILDLGLNFLPRCWLMHFIILLLKVYVVQLFVW